MADQRRGGDSGGLAEFVQGLIRMAVREATSSFETMRRRYELVVRLGLDEDGQAGRLDYLVRAADDPSLVLTPSAADFWRRPVSFATTRGSEVMSVGRRVQRAARVFPPMQRCLGATNPTWLQLAPEEVGEFVHSAAKKLARQGVVVQLPAELTYDGRARLKARLHVGQTDEDSVKSSWGMGEAATEPFRWEVTLGGAEVSAEEFAEIVKAKRPVVQVRGRWVAVDQGELAEASKALGDLRSGTMPAAQATGLAVAGEVQVAKSLAATVVARGRVDRAAEAAASVVVERDALEPEGFVGTLRPYQRRGLAWLLHLERASFGGVLADDMGLGKTIQAIALIQTQTVSGSDRSATLVVCPASVLPNWERELQQFAPGLRVVRHHGATRARRAEALARWLQPGTVVLTTYGTLRSSQKLLASVTWERVLLDEAQSVKNPSAAQSRAARTLNTRHRVALTGTPVENRLDDLWAIMQFVNPGLLGPRATFRERFAAPVERGDTGAGERLRRLTRPFVLRRTKSDPAIAADLPPKVEADVACNLTVEQATLYQAAVDQAIADIEQAEGMRRRARVLTLLTELKQICDHPALYLHEKAPLPERSGKLDRLTEMLEETVAQGEATLVFTQFTEMGRMMARHLKDALELDVPMLHGGLSLRDRQELVDAFQQPAGPPLMIVSLRAGGLGLNLTRATHVIHFDRWWNPAVEDQATDRAHRIGQTKTVFVHRLHVAGTLEERIADLISRKRSIAGLVVQPDEAWLTELPTAELRRLVDLS